MFLAGKDSAGSSVQLSSSLPYTLLAISSSLVENSCLDWGPQ
jgi:hypothetical protein